MPSHDPSLATSSSLLGAPPALRPSPRLPDHSAEPEASDEPGQDPSSDPDSSASEVSLPSLMSDNSRSHDPTSSSVHTNRSTSSGPDGASNAATELVPLTPSPTPDPPTAPTPTPGDRRQFTSGGENHRGLNIPGYRLVHLNHRPLSGNAFLGKGNHATVYSGVADATPNLVVAIKVSNPDDKENPLPNEAAVLKPTNPDREHIRKLHTTFDRDVGEVEILILEFCDGSLQNLLVEAGPHMLQENGSPGQPIPLIKVLFSGIIKESAVDQQTVTDSKAKANQGLRFLGRHYISHRDIRPANILVNIDPLMAKLSDFAGAAEDDSNSKDFVAFRGPIAYSPPDLKRGLGWRGLHVDMWGAGCVLAYMLDGRPLSQATTQENYFDFLKESMKASRKFESSIKHTSDVLWPTANEDDIEFTYQAKPNCDQNALQLLRGLLQFQPRHRWSPSQCLEHSFLKDANEVQAEAVNSIQRIISHLAAEKDALDPNGEWLLYNVTRSAEN